MTFLLSVYWMIQKCLDVQAYVCRVFYVYIVLWSLEVQTPKTDSKTQWKSLGKSPLSKRSLHLRARMIHWLDSKSFFGMMRTSRLKRISFCSTDFKCLTTLIRWQWRSVSWELYKWNASCDKIDFFLRHCFRTWKHKNVEVDCVETVHISISVRNGGWT